MVIWYDLTDCVSMTLVPTYLKLFVLKFPQSHFQNLKRITIENIT